MFLEKLKINFMDRVDKVVPSDAIKIPVIGRRPYILMRLYLYRSPEGTNKEKTFFFPVIHFPSLI